MRNFSGDIERLSTELMIALERAAEHLETCSSDERVSDATMAEAADGARALASEIGSKECGDERLDLLLQTLDTLKL